MERFATPGRDARSAVVRASRIIGALACSVNAQQVPTTLNDFFGPGTQPRTLGDAIVSVKSCDSCHGNYDIDHEPLRAWAASMMGQAMRDPLFDACMTVANQDAAFAGDLCLRCHTPGGWLAGRSEPTDGSALQQIDYEGVSCNFCHRMVDPEYKPGISPAEDEQILLDLPDHPVNPHSGQYIVDPLDRRRGPFDLGNFNKHDWLWSPFHSASEMCATCHEVSNPVFERQPDGTYAPGDLDTPHPTHNKYDEFPIERTYSEWLASEFAAGPIEMGGRFGGNKTAVGTCQDCHMPDATGKGCKTGELRDNLPTHYFNGGSTWMLRAIDSLYPRSETFLEAESIAASVARAEALLAAASDLELAAEPGELYVRVINQTGHKLPSGYPEGRRIWINVRFLDGQGDLVAERGRYNSATAELTPNTKIYEAELGVDQVMSDLTGIPVGPSFHFAVNNLWYKDNRIPPRGFTNAGFEAVQAAPVGYSYDDGQYWDDTQFEVPAGAVLAEVRVYYQSASKEYVEFLRDENHTDDAGQILYNTWVAQNMGPPVEIDFAAIAVEDDNGCVADFNGDGIVDTRDVLAFLNAWNAGAGSADIDGNGTVDTRDVLAFLNLWNAGCG